MMKSILRVPAVLALCMPMVVTADDARVFQAKEISGADGAVWLSGCVIELVLGPPKLEEGGLS